jgi:hypothetical protein
MWNMGIKGQSGFIMRQGPRTSEGERESWNLEKVTLVRESLPEKGDARWSSRRRGEERDGNEGQITGEDWDR